MNQEIPAREDSIVIGERDGLQLAIKRSASRNLKEIISRPDSPSLINSVLVELLQVHPDDRGFFAEWAWPVSYAVQLFMSFFLRMNPANADMSLFFSLAGAFA